MVYNKIKGAATILATPRPIAPSTSITIIMPIQNPITFKPSSKLKGKINRPIAEQANRANQNLVKVHLSFQYKKATTKQQKINTRYAIDNSFFVKGPKNVVFTNILFIPFLTIKILWSNR